MVSTGQLVDAVDFAPALGAGAQRAQWHPRLEAHEVPRAQFVRPREVLDELLGGEFGAPLQEKPEDGRHEQSEQVPKVTMVRRMTVTVSRRSARRASQRDHLAYRLAALLP